MCHCAPVLRFTAPLPGLDAWGSACDRGDCPEHLPPESARESATIAFRVVSARMQSYGIHAATKRKLGWVPSGYLLLKPPKACSGKSPSRVPQPHSVLRGVTQGHVKDHSSCSYTQLIVNVCRGNSALGGSNNHLVQPAHDIARRIEIRYRGLLMGINLQSPVVVAPGKH